MGDFNAKFDSKITPEITRKHSVEERNERGKRLIDFFQYHLVYITEAETIQRKVFSG